MSLWVQPLPQKEHSDGGADNGGGCVVWGQEIHRDSVLCTRFCCEPKIALKNKVYLKTKNKTRAVPD